jgi:type II secretory pathway component HofQ
MNRTLAFLAAAALSILVGPVDTASAAPSGLPSQALDLQLKQVEIGNVFRMLAEASQRKVVLDPCVKGKVDLKLKNTPLPLVYDALALKMRLRYGERDGAVTVGCLGAGEVAAAPDPRLETRVSVEQRGASARAVLGVVAKAAGLAGLDFRAREDPKVTLLLENARLRTVLAAIADGTGLAITVEGDRLVATGG